MAYNPLPMEGNTIKTPTILNPNMLLRIRSSYKGCRPIKVQEQECSRGFSNRLLLSDNHITVDTKMKKKYTTTKISRKINHTTPEFNHRLVKVWKRRIDQASCHRRFHLGPIKDRVHGLILEALISLIRILQIIMRLAASFLQNRPVNSKTISP